jgi:hypothetical protein
LLRVPIVETETTQEEARPRSVEELLDVGRECAVAVGVHDSSRLEWTAVVSADAFRRYRLVVELDVPSNLAPAQLPWAQLQSLVRFERPHDRCDHQDPVARLREEALITTSRLAVARNGFVRHVGRLATDGAPEAEHEALVVWFHAGQEAIHRARANLAEQADPRVERESRLVDEYLSTQVVSMLTGMARALDGLEHKDAWVERLQPRLVDGLIAESDHRQAHGYVSIEDTSPDGLARYVERRATLKKRFQAVLYLRRESTPAEERIRPWVAALSAATAGMVAFSVQLFFGAGRGLGQKVGWSFVVLLAVAALAYGMKERLQIAGVQWLSRGLGRWYARRSTRVFSAENALVLTARESFAERPGDSADGEEASPTVRIRFVHEARLHPAAAHGQLRLIFRYDLSPLFPRMHDPLKVVGVVDRDARSVRFVDAPRTYRLPIRMELSAEGLERTQSASLVMDKFGLHRIELALKDAGEGYPPTV